MMFGEESAAYVAPFELGILMLQLRLTPPQTPASFLKDFAQEPDVLQC